MTVLENLESVLREIASRASQGAAYAAWTDAFARKEVQEAWEDREATMRKARGFRVTVEQLRQIPKADLYRIGFGNWDDGAQTLIPLWAYHYIANGEELTSIGGDKVTKTDHSQERGHADYIDLDVRFGCVAWGFQ